jgi:hypothetical protein
MNRLPLDPRAAFADAVQTLAEDPSSANVVRYLVASRNLERPSRAAVSKPKSVRVRETV